MKKKRRRTKEEGGTENEVKENKYYLKSRGSTMEEQNQVTLAKVEEELDRNDEVEVRILAKPLNIVDSNAYRVDASVYSNWLIIGHIL